MAQTKEPAAKNASMMTDNAPDQPLTPHHSESFYLSNPPCNYEAEGHSVPYMLMVKES